MLNRLNKNRVFLHGDIKDDFFFFFLILTMITILFRLKLYDCTESGIIFQEVEREIVIHMNKI